MPNCRPCSGCCGLYCLKGSTRSNFVTLNTFVYCSVRIPYVFHLHGRAPRAWGYLLALKLHGRHGATGRC